MAFAQSPNLAKRTALVIDDETHFLTSIRFILGHIGIESVDTCDDSRKALAMVQSKPYENVLLDISMPHVPGAELLKQILELSPSIQIIMITAVNEIGTAVSCIKAGAFDYLLKPIEEERLATTVNNACQLIETRRENIDLMNRLTSGSLQHPDIFQNIVTQNNSLIGIFSYIEAVAPSKQPVLITGETGTGKELIARALHDASGRNGPYIPVNIAGIAENLADDELFGHCKEAFTGANHERAGMAENALGGTLFLDEIGDLPLMLQVKLLRLIQEGQFKRLGSDKINTTNARIVVATNRDLEAQVTKGTFRADLFYRLCTHRINLPPLRERKDDIPMLVDHFLEAAAREMNKKKPSLPKQLYTLLSTYSFPGNVRELRGMIFDAVCLFTTGTLSIESFKSKIFPAQEAPASSVPRDKTFSQKKVHFSNELPTSKEVQELLINEALKAADGNQTIAAGILGLSRRALNIRLSRKQE